MVYNYYFALASQKFLLNEEPLEEILRERTEYYQSKNKNIDFWLVLNPNFINFSKLDINSSNVSNSCAAIISLDKNFIQWLKLRMGFIMIGEFTSTSIFLPTS
uniref:Putative chloroplast RF54 n=1 Tax=Cumathamnion serrulatum TaxID=1206573 RepID=A0A7U1AR43_9FLOR|nr:putative chloroplast RF54 [Cumathamnion serrulatum]QQY85379.1 putative chloroplast RF54 [Cumathamnion serrulatum]